MASRKAEKEEARAQRVALEQQHDAVVRRRQRLYGLGAVVAVAVIVVVAAIAISSSGGGGGSGGIATGTTATQVVSDVNAELAGIPQSGNRLGKSTAPVTITYYGDLECPICRDFTLGALPQIMRSYVRTGKAKIEYRSLETASPDPSVFETQQVAAEAAGKQNREWQFLELFYNQQGAEGTDYATESYLDGLAAQVPGLNTATWKTDRTDPKLAGQVAADANAATAAQASGTPTLIITGPNGTKSLTGNVPYADASAAIQAVS
jgi:protein-disulfide isomerase